MLPPILAVAATMGISSADYPPNAARQGHDGVVGIQYTVDPSGHVSKCRVMLTSGWPELDAATCAAIVKKGRFPPALDGGGHPIDDVRQLRFHWALPNAANVRHFPSLPVTGEIAVAAFPKDMARPLANAAFRVGTDGAITDCTVKQDDGTGSAALDKAACDTIRAAGFPVVLDHAGKAISYDRVMTIVFSVSPARIASHQ